ncbi:hypothetical protein CBL_06026 [Carabus blaptoides fortunei]
MNLFKAVCYILILLCAFVNVRSNPLPDSAGIVEMPPGLAYGGIPYGSVTGMVANYYNGGRGLKNEQQPLRPVITRFH